MPEQKRTERLDWEDLRHALALARHGSLSATARALRVNHATVARRVAALEAAIGLALFDRRAEGYVPTAAGRAVLDAAAPMDEAALAVLGRAAAGDALAGPVRLTTTRSLAEAFLVRRLAPLRDAHPAIDLEVIAELRVASLARREADIALRLGRPQGGGLRARRVGAIAHGFFASPAIAARVGGGAPPPLIGYDQDSDFVPEAVWLQARFPDARFAFRSNSQVAQAEAAGAGLGIALLPHFLAAGRPGLAPVGLGALPPEREIWLVLREESARVPRMRLVADWIAALFRREAALFAAPAG